MKKLFIKSLVIFVIITLTSCRSIDVEKRNGMDLSEENQELKDKLEKAEAALSLYQKEDEYVYDIEPVLVPVNNYVVVDRSEFNAKAKDEKEVSGRDAVKKLMKESVVPLKEYTGGMSIFDYDENFQFPVFTKKLSMTTIILNNDEVMTTDNVYLSDSKSWEVTGDVWNNDEGEKQLIMIKPLLDNLETDMLVVTSKRLYKFILYSTKTDYQPMVKFRYPTERKFITSKTKKNNPLSLNTNYGQIDMDKVSFNYVIHVPVFQKKVDWTPELVYDDGAFTYIRLPEIVLQKEYPVFYEGNNDIVNYEIHPTQHNLIIINKLIEKVTLKVGKQKITIKKKKGEPKTYSVKR